MSRILFLFLLIPLFAKSQLGVVAFGDTIKSFNPATGEYVQINKQVPSFVGQSGKLLSNNGSSYNWVTGDFAAASHTHVIGDVSNLQTSLDAKSSTSHTHAFSDITSKPTTISGYGITDSKGYTIFVQALTSSPTDAQTIYFGMLPKAPTTTAATSKIYIRKAGTIKIAEIYCYSGTAGTNEAWVLNIRLNNTTDTQIASVSASTNERVFSNTGLSISVSVGDYIEIKSVNPTWATNPLTTIFGGYIYIE